MFWTKEIFKLLTIITVALFIIITIAFIKYNPVYAVKLNDEVIGYVKSKTVMEDIINEEVLTSDNPCAIFTELNVEPTYELKLSDTMANDEEKIAQILSENTTTMYKVYAIAINGEIESYVNTLDEAENIIQSHISQAELSKKIENNKMLTKKIKNIKRTLFFISLICLIEFIYII